MDISEIIVLPVSLGEAIDKLTILDIKLSKITDSRRDDVQKEYIILYEKLQSFVICYKGLYESMKKINILIWDFMEILRDGTITDADYATLCRKTVDYNDIRFRIKNKINLVSGSTLREQKGYKITRILVDISDTIQSIDQFVKPIQYYSLLYDQVVVRYSGNSTHSFNDDTIILVHTILEDVEFKYSFKFNSTENILDIFKIDEQIMNTIL